MKIRIKENEAGRRIQRKIGNGKITSRETENLK